jgi:hypothetical protein
LLYQSGFTDLPRAGYYLDKPPWLAKAPPQRVGVWPSAFPFAHGIE